MTNFDTSPQQGTCSGVTGVPGGEGAPGAYAIGSAGPGGGIIFYDKGEVSDGWQYLEVSPAGWSGGSDPTAIWCNNAHVSVDADYPDIGEGKTNTGIMIDNCTSSAAISAKSYNGGGKSDWFLPSIDELAELYEHKASVGGLGASIYWSSSEYSTDNAWYYNFSNGSKNGYGKDLTASVRPVRSF
ncbi:MAG: DUF1566 domain-containing protein [Candidatus Saccharimonas sp.]